MKAFKNISLFSMLLTMVSCSQFLTHRDYLSEMEHDDSSFYNPEQDFPVVAGDTGQMYETSANRRARTPASAREAEQNSSQKFLNAELRTLEGKLSETSRETYEAHKHRMNVSERIYYLKLTNYERRDYLESRGFVTDRKPASAQEDMFVQRTSSVNMGMSKSDVVANLGKPSRVEVAGNPSFENERWLYNVNGASKYIYFESGRVGGWE